jgi:hypothetical protein
MPHILDIGPGHHRIPRQLDYPRYNAKKIIRRIPITMRYRTLYTVYWAKQCCGAGSLGRISKKQHPVGEVRANPRCGSGSDDFGSYSLIYYDYIYFFK